MAEQHDLCLSRCSDFALSPQVDTAVPDKASERSRHRPSSGAPTSLGSSSVSRGQWVPLRSGVLDVPRMLAYFSECSEVECLFGLLCTLINDERLVVPKGRLTSRETEQHLRLILLRAPSRSCVLVLLVLAQFRPVKGSSEGNVSSSSSGVSWSLQTQFPFWRWRVRATSVSGRSTGCGPCSPGPV